MKKWAIVIVLMVGFGAVRAQANGAPDWAYPYPALHSYLDETYKSEFQQTLRICRERPWKLLGVTSRDGYVVSPAREAECLESAVLAQLQALSNTPGWLVILGEDYQKSLELMAESSRALAKLALPQNKDYACDCGVTTDQLTLKLYSAQLIELMRQIYLIRLEQGR